MAQGGLRAHGLCPQSIRREPGFGQKMRSADLYSGIGLIGTASPVEFCASAQYEVLLDGLLVGPT
jgi:hypothetical protein